eukprot:750902-Hanusia_phi.AAC.1
MRKGAGDVGRSRTIDLGGKHRQNFEVEVISVAMIGKRDLSSDVSDASKTAGGGEVARRERRVEGNEEELEKQGKGAEQGVLEVITSSARLPSLSLSDTSAPA